MRIEGRRNAYERRCEKVRSHTMEGIEAMAGKLSSKHLVDPELLAALETLPTFDFSKEVLPLVRRGLDDMLAAAPVPEGLEVDVTERRITTPEGHDIGVLIYAPRGGVEVRPAVLHIHGGGYILGTARLNDISNRKLAIDARCTIISVGYRLAPETTHPGPLEDCYAALKWVHGNAESLGIDRHRIAVSGESAGGGLATLWRYSLVIAVRCR